MTAPRVSRSWWPWPTRQQVNDALYRLWVQHVSETEATTLSLQEMRNEMASTDEIVARLGSATDELARDLAALRDEVAGSDAAIAAKFEPLVSRLEQMGADPENPVPDPEPQPEEPAEPEDDEPQQ